MKADTLHSQLKGALCGFALAVALILAGATGASAQEMGSSHFPGLASANQVIAGPVTGAPSLPSARALVSADIPQNLTLGTLNIGANVGLPGTSLLMVNANTVAPPGFVSGSEYLIANFVAPNSDVGVIFFDTYGPASSTNPNCCFGGLAFRRADGTSSAPTPLQTGDIIGTIDAHGNDGNTNAGQSGYISGGAIQIRFNATENWAASGTTSTNNGANLTIVGTPNGSGATGNLKQIASFAALTTTAVNITVGVPGTTIGSVTAPLFNGGSAAASNLTIQSTTGAGSSDLIQFETGSQSVRGTINTVGKWSLGANVPASSNAPFLDVNQNASNAIYSSIINNPMLRLVNADGGASALVIQSFQSGTGIFGSTAEGTLASPSNSNSGRNEFSLNGYSYSGGAFNLSANVSLTTAEAGLSGSGSVINFGVTALTTTTDAVQMRLQNNGSLSLGSANLATIGGAGVMVATGFQAGVSPGLTQTCTVNQAKTLIFTLGILTGGSCNS